jgi:hypothetical protein
MLESPTSILRGMVAIYQENDFIFLGVFKSESYPF